MRKPILLIFTNACILIVVFMMMAQSLFIVQRAATAGTVEGQVLVSRVRGTFAPLRAGDTITVGDVVKTSKNGRAEFTWADKTRWKLEPNSQLTIEKAALNTLKKSEVSRFKLDAGQMFVRVVKPMSDTSRFEVQTPTALASVHGTVFMVSVENGHTRVGTYKGSVDVTGGGTEKTVNPGREVLVQNDNIAPVSAGYGSLFDFQPSLTLPELKAEVQLFKDPMALLRGETEVGDKLKINGQDVPLLGNGRFISPQKMKAGYNEWKIETTDKHGAVSSTCRAAEWDATTKSAKLSDCK